MFRACSYLQVLIQRQSTVLVRQAHTKERCWSIHPRGRKGHSWPCSLSQLAARHRRSRSQRGRKGNPNRKELTPRPSPTMQRPVLSTRKRCAAATTSHRAPPQSARYGGSVHTTADRSIRAKPQPHRAFLVDWLMLKKAS
jgi:hypothetical protein